MCKPLAMAALFVLVGLWPWGDARAARKARVSSDALPAEAVLTNLRSPTGRTVYLLLRARKDLGPELSDRAERLARTAGAEVKVKQAGDLWIVVLTHKDHALGVHRLGDDLRLDSLSPALYSADKESGIRLSADRPDSDLDQEIYYKRAM